MEKCSENALNNLEKITEGKPLIYAVHVAFITSLSTLVGTLIGGLEMASSITLNYRNQTFKITKDSPLINKKMTLTKKKFRNNGAIGALLDEYEKALNELIETIDSIQEKQLLKIIDFETDDEDCKSIQNILTHVVQSGYTYVVEIRKWLGEKIDYKDKIKYSTTEEYKSALKEMFEFNEQLFFDYPNLELCENNPNKKINVRWGQNYDVEQLLEHAIVHILRHRRQIERFKVM